MANSFSGADFKQGFVHRQREGNRFLQQPQVFCGGIGQRLLDAVDRQIGDAFEKAARLIVAPGAIGVEPQPQPALDP